MARDFDIETLVEDLAATRPIGWQPSVLLAAIGTLAGMAFVAATIGLRTNYGASFLHPMFLLRSGLLAMLASAALAGAISMARPAVGRRSTGWHWAIAAAAIFPIAAIPIALTSPIPVAERLHPEFGTECLVYSIGLGAMLSAALTATLRRGAPVAPARAGTAVGLAGGGFGALAYSMHCPFNDVVYIGFWYTLAIAASGLAGRFFFARFLRW